MAAGALGIVLIIW